MNAASPMAITTAATAAQRIARPNGRRCGVVGTMPVGASGCCRSATAGGIGGAGSGLTAGAEPNRNVALSSLLCGSRRRSARASLASRAEPNALLLSLQGAREPLTKRLERHDSLEQFVEWSADTRRVRCDVPAMSERATSASWATSVLPSSGGKRGARRREGIP